MNNQPPENEQKKLSRRDFLSFSFFKKILDKPRDMVSESDVSEEDVQKGAEELIAKLGRKKINRRTLVKGAALMAGGFAVDTALKHLPSTYLKRFLTDQNFRNKVLEELHSGEVLETVQQVVESQITENRDFEIGEKVDLKEEWMGNCFSNSTCYKLKGKDIPSYQDRYLIALEIDNAIPLENEVDIFKGEEVVNFTKTVQKIKKPLVILPSNQQESYEDPSHPTFNQEAGLYSAYVKSDGSIVEQFDKIGEATGGRSQNRGAVIVDMENKVKVCNFDEAQKYQIGKNCLAIESCTFTIDSETLDEDLATLQAAGSLSGMDISTSPRHNSCLVTYFDSENIPHTFALSRYQHIDFDTISYTGNQNNKTLLNMFEFAQLCKGVMKKKGFKRFVMQVPDPGSESELKTSEFYTNDQVSNLGDQATYFATEKLGADKPSPEVIAAIGLQRHRVLGDRKPLEYPTPKKMCIAAVRS